MKSYMFEWERLMVTLSLCLHDECTCAHSTTFRVKKTRSRTQKQACTPYSGAWLDRQKLPLMVIHDAIHIHN